jgi:hypothetical protein
MLEIIFPRGSLKLSVVVVVGVVVVLILVILLLLLLLIVVVVVLLTSLLCKFADKLKNVALFTGLQEHGEKPNLTPNFPYSFCYLEEKSEIILAVKNEKSACISNVDWIKGQLFPKIIKWAETADIEGESNRLVTTSLNLVNMVKYNELYQHLKKKYGLQMIQVKQIHICEIYPQKYVEK